MWAYSIYNQREGTLIRNLICWHLENGLLASRTGRKYNSIVSMTKSPVTTDFLILFWFICTWYIFFTLFIFNLRVLALSGYWRQHTVYYLIQPESSCLLIGELKHLLLVQLYTKTSSISVFHSLYCTLGFLLLPTCCCIKCTIAGLKVMHIFILMVVDIHL